MPVRGDVRVEPGIRDGVGISLAAHNDETPDEPCEYDRLIFEIVRQPDPADRRMGLVAALRGASFVRVDDAAHFLMLDQPDVFAARVDVFID